MYPMEEVDPYMPQEPPSWLLKKTRGKLTPEVQSAGGALTDNVQAGQSKLPSAIARYRQMATDLYGQGSDLMDQEPDMAPMQAYAKQRSQQGDAAMLNALAAQYAGESFEPIQAQYLKKAAASKDPMKMGSGYLTPEGQYLKDPEVAQSKKAEFLLNQAKAYETLAQNAQTAQERNEAQRLADQRNDELRRMMMESRAAQAADSNAIRREALAARQASAGGGGKAPAGYQWTTTADGQAALTFIPGGPADPKNKKQGEPTEDERKAAGWFFQADNARRNMEQVIRSNPGAAYPTVPERAASFIPGVGVDIANSIRPADRQKFVQASESMSEALLRAATGAGVNRDEQAQKVRELVPQLGDKPEVVKQKIASYDVYMNALKARAGRAMPAGTPSGGAGGNVVDFSTLPK